jgi:hypothetical protein
MARVEPGVIDVHVLAPAFVETPAVRDTLAGARAALRALREALELSPLARRNSG